MCGLTLVWTQNLDFKFPADSPFHEKASQVFDSRTSFFLSGNLTAQLSESGSQAPRMGTTITARRRGLAPAGAGFIPPFFSTQTVTLPFALFLGPAIVPVHVKIRRQELQSVKRTRYIY